MAVRAVPAGNSRGGAGISPSRPARARVAAGVGSLGAAAAASGYAALSAGRLGGVAAAFAGTGLAILTAALLVRRQALIPWAILAIGGGYLVGRVGHSSVDGLSAAVGVLLLLAAELAAWSIENDSRIHTERSVVVRRTVTLVSLALAAAVLDVVALGASGLPGGAGVAVAAAGVAAAVSAVAVIARLARRV